MSNETEAGTCSICKKRTSSINRKYYYYDIECDCCNSKSDDHFELVFHCENCEPVPPSRVTCVLSPLKDDEAFKGETLKGQSRKRTKE